MGPPLYVGVLVGLWPRFGLFFGFAVCFVSPLAKRKSGWEICLSSFFVCVFLWLCVGLIDLPNTMDLCPCTNFFVCSRSYKDRAFSDIGQTRGKKTQKNTRGQVRQPAGEGSHHTAQQKQQKRKPSNTRGGTQRPQRRQPQNNRPKHKQRETKQKSQNKRGTKEQNQKKQTEGKESTA